MNSGMFQVPDSHPTPSVFPSGFGGSFLVGLVFRRCPLRRRCFAWLLCCFCMHAFNACITRYGGRWPRQPPPPLRSSLQLFRIPRVLGQGRCPAELPTQCSAEPSWPPHFCPADPQSEGPNDRSGGATVLSHKCCGRDVLKT